MHAWKGKWSLSKLRKFSLAWIPCVALQTSDRWQH